ncbi:uncharacterized protein EDB93DRAFT_1103008 [Suillus bovinus]|uniref:uncharacterized protein n=1 Tax=Suillus bovinus TaxID=48563 RepID=UPI001B87BB5C|nr:uncharacterized protein EDB93DRAFT_1103008 [Suillus bovinus]KAG2151556.1 hypothetical protein EDB93DRAFT_1103008 [Suillus bovinus]
MCACKEKIISKCFRAIMEPFVPENFQRLCSVLYDSKAVVTGSCAITMLLGPVVLAAPSTADMVFMSPGGLCTFYPTLTLKNNAILSLTGFLIEPEMSIGSVWSEHFSQSVDELALACGAMPLLPPKCMVSDLNTVVDACFLISRHSYVIVKALLPVQAFPPPNAFMRNLFSHMGINHEIKGNVLVIKHPKQDRNKVLDVTEAFSFTASNALTVNTQGWAEQNALESV